MQNTPAHVFVWFATAKLGVVEVPINTAYRGDILTHIVTSARVTSMVLDAEFVPVVARIADRCPGLGTFIVAGGDREEARRALPGAVLSLDEIATGDGADRPRPIEATTTACIMFTSGTTGPSKGVVINNHFELSFAVIFNEIVSLGAGDVTYNFLPFFHIAGKFIMLGTMLADCRMLLRPRFIEFKADLPRTPTQKVRKVVLRADGITAATWDREEAGFKVTRDGLARRL